jgi:hypothetical protein
MDVSEEKWMATCAECGAVWAGQQNCQAVYEGFLAQEFTDSGYGEVHFLTVCVFMLQHGRYSDQALAWVVPAMRAYLAGEKTTEQLRRESQAALGQGQRHWRVRRAAAAPPARAVAWDYTLAEVAAAAHDAESYRAAITTWAQRTVSQWEATT